MSVAARVVQRRKEQRFDDWMHRAFHVSALDEYIPTYMWMEGLVDTVLDVLYRYDYILLLNEHELTNKLLNHLHTFERLYLKGKSGRSYDVGNYRQEDLDYFFSKKCPPEFWEELRRQNEIEWFADNDEFSKRVWIELPFWVAQYIDFKNSLATADVASMGEEDGGASDTERKIKREVDPYVQDYYSGW
jgi:hypothetical protein